MRVISIDIGLTGAIASVDTRGRSRIDDMPTLTAEEPSKQAKRRIDNPHWKAKVRQVLQHTGRFARTGAARYAIQERLAA